MSEVRSRKSEKTGAAEGRQESTEASERVVSRERADCSLNGRL